MAGNKRSCEERLKHISALEKAIAEGRTPTEAVHAVARTFELTRSSVWRDYGIIKRRWAKRAEEERRRPECQFGHALVRRDQMYRMAIANVDVGAALAIEKDRCALLGLYPDTTLTLKDGREKTAEQMPDEELARIAAGGRATDNDDTPGSGDGTPAAAGGEDGPTGVHEVHVPGLPGELAPPADLPAGASADPGRDQQAHDLHATTEW